MVKFSSTVSNQIRLLLQSMDGTNFDSVFPQLCQFTEYGTDGCILLLRTCMDHVKFYERSLKDMQQEQVLAAVFKYLLGKPNFCTVLSESLKTTETTEQFLENLSNALDLTLSEKIGFGLAMSDSENLETRLCGKNFCMTQIEELCCNPMSFTSSEKLQSVIFFLQRSDGLSKHVDSFMQIISLMQSKETTPLILTPYLSEEMREAEILRNVDLLLESGESDFDSILADIQKEISMGDIMKELGYGCTVNTSQCIELFSLFLPLTESTLAKVLGAIARTHTGLEDNQSAFLTFANAMGYSNLSELPPLSSWNIEVLIDTIRHLAPGTNWVWVIENLDHEGFYIPSEEAFSFFMSVYKHACQDPFPLHAICGSVWKNSEGQLSFLKYAVSSPPEVFTFAHSMKHLQAYMDAINGHKLQVGNANHAWLCLDLLDILCQLAERGHASFVRSMVDYPLKNCPEALLLGMAHVNTAYNLLQHEVAYTVFPIITKSTGRSGMILYLWHVNPSLMLRGVSDSVNNDPDSIIRIFDICQDLKIVPSVLDMVPSSVGIRLAAIASRKELLDLEKWLSHNLTTYKDIFFEECLKFLKDIHFHVSQNFSANTFHYPGDLLNIFVETTSSFMKVLQAYNNTINSSHLSEELERLQQKDANTSTLRLQNGATAESSNLAGYADDIEAEANSYFHQVFSGEVTVEAIVQMLARFKESSVERERSISDCMIANLFEEYRFFPKYPEKQLRITALLFGSLIKNQLVTHLPLGIALRCVLDSLRKPADSKMFLFGTLALEQFVDRLIEWPQYCNHILQISHLRSTHPDIVAFIEQALARISLGHADADGPNQASNVSNHISSVQGVSGQVELHTSSVQTAQQLTSLQPRQESTPDDHSKISAGSSNDMKHNPTSLGQPTAVAPTDSSGIQKAQNTLNPPSMLASSPGFVRSSRGSSARFGSALNIETLVAAAVKREIPVEAPVSEIQDKISFIINNLSAANIEAKAKEFVDIMKGQYYPWFAEYMVMKRASIEPNFHDLYLKFLDKVNSKALNKEIVQATYENCKVLLGSELIKSSSEERSLLKNLGSWLGKLTIGRNQVLRAREIDPKSLIMEAYEKGLMIAVIPFTSKILEPCQNSLAYQAPNPWTMGILGLLAEIYSMPNLKMNLKFDIEVLFKHLGVDMKEVTPTSLLKDRKREIEGNPDFSNKDLGASQAQMISDLKPALVPPTNQVDLPLDVNNATNGGQTHVMPQYPLHLPTGPLVDEEKVAALDQLPSAAGLLPNAPSPSPFAVSQLPTSIPNIGTHVIINQKLSALGLHVHFQRVVPIAMDRAIKEIVAGIVQRSVSIATQTTKELVLKDYAMESDETRIFNAAHLMVASLAGSLAHVTCKEPLRGSISSQLRNSLQGLSTASELLEQAVQLVTNDNLDLGCAVIEQAATDKAIQTIDGEIAQHLTLRRKNREGMGPTFFDANLYTQGSMGVLPEALRPKPGHLSLSQQRVYEDFVRLPWQNQSSQSSHALPVGPSTPSGSTSLSGGYGPSSSQLSSGYSNSLGSTGFEGVSRPIDDTADLNPASNYSASSIHIRSTNAVPQNVSENDSVVSSFPSAATTPELHPVDASDSVQDSGTSLQPLPSPILVERLGSNASEPSLTTRDALDKYQTLAQKLEALISNESRDSEIQAVVSEVPEIILRCVSRDEAALAVAQKAFKGLYDNASNSIHVGAHLAILAAIRDVCKLAVKELTSWVIYSEEERKFNKDISVGLIRNELLNLADYNVHMAKLIDGGRNKAATEFSISLLQSLVVEESKVISELHNLVDALGKLATKSGSPESLQQLIEIVKNPAASASILSSVGKDDKTRQAKEKKISGLPPAIREEYNAESVEPDPAGFREQVSLLFADWYRICELPGSNDAACTHFILQLHQNGFLKGDDMTDRFFRILTELSVAHCLTSEVVNSGIQNLSFLAIDIYAKLVYSIIKGATKPFLLSKILAVTVRFILKEAEEKIGSFNPRPLFRLFINWLLDLGSLEPIIDGANFQILTAFANAFHALQPLKIPAFSFVWLELISHKSFMPKMLTANGQKGWPHIQRLLVDLFQFMEPFLRNAEMGMAVNFLYKGTLRVLLVLLHDFPEFLCDYHFTFCDVIPPSCIQMRNIILSAFPRNMRLPDPSTPNLKIDLLQEITQSPRILSEVDAALKAKQLKADVDEYLKTRQQGSSFLTDLKQKLLLLPSEVASAGTRYNVPLINSLVLYVGMQAIQQLQARTQLSQTTPNTFPLAVLSVGAALEIFQTLMMELDTEGRYLFLNAAANQLRYPNTHTHYFSFILLYLFSEANQEIIQEQITRVLLERLIVNRPHPWGLLITFIELIKNPRYNFWNRGFIRCAPEIEKLFESVSRSCGGPKPVDDSMVSGWVADGPH